MKTKSYVGFLPARSGLIAALTAALAAPLLLAQTPNQPDDIQRNQGQPTTATGSGYHSGKAGADVDSTREINAQNPRLTGDKLSWGDRRFVYKAADASQSKLHLADLAALRASNPEVRRFAQQLITDHTKVNAALLTLATQKNLNLDFDDDKDRAYKRLNRKSGMEFDHEFVEHLIDEHENAIRMFEKAASDAKDTDVRALASNHVATLREHLQEAKELRQTLTPTGRIDERSGRRTTDEPSNSRTRTTDADTKSRDAKPVDPRREAVQPPKP